ncbi:NAD(P)H-dependent oxidoreductase [Desulfobotulus sp. H1]|uniref:NAD(P)H-dependent oxidoreductase n=1 Tax=Desulfobotulus pelophilus TaxID=2823377 RepID=A0ABT3N5H1_9BACT|nr:NAD(P)H-dependent oxidoreductase [Desulfobotulus pelophilus]MCW7752707.1 NAD(P)H-dependent oxidoreductase [Desulfobotulus pelophilus]
MQITVISGSPKGELSVTLQSLRYLEKKFPEHSMHVVHVGQTIRSIEEKAERREEIRNLVKVSELVLFVHPVYTFSIPSQLKRFMEIVHETDLKEVFAGKYAAVLTTSIHFFDHSAHAYMRAVIEDLGMAFAGAFSADSYDLLNEREQQRLECFATDLLATVSLKRPVSRAYAPLAPFVWDYVPLSSPSVLDSRGKKVVIIQDKRYRGINAGAMADRLASRFPDADRIILEDIFIMGGCLGCVQCGFDHRCVFTGKDDFIRTYEDRIKPADILFFVMKIEDRMFSSLWKTFFDRGFYNTHTPTLREKQLGFVISGPLGQMAPFREVLTAFTEWQGAGLVDLVSDECADASVLDSQLDTLAERTVEASELGYVAPPTFLGRAGMKVFRDDVFGRHRFVFQADHEWFEANGIYDFPHDDKRAMDTNAFMLELMKDPDTREAIRKMLKSEMVKPIRKVVEMLNT